jgi:hypothetical protein
MTKKLTGTEPYQTPLNADLGTMAYIDKDNMPDISVRWINVKDPNNRQSSLELYTSDYYRDSNDAAIAYNWRFTNEGNVNRLRLLGTNPNMAVPTIFPLYVEGTTQDVVLSGNLRVASGKGIDFSATANGSGTTSSEILDDYEEGTWVPTFGAETSNPTMTYLTQVGRYTKVGNLVTAYCQIITATRSGGSGHLTLDGLPFTVAPAVAYASAAIGFNYNWNTAPLNAGAQGSTTHVILYQDARTNVTATPVDIVASGNSYLNFVVSYETTL